MSRGPGRVERIIAATFEVHPNECFTMYELAPLIYPEILGTRQIEKKHRSAILRAVKNVLDELRWGYFKASEPGGPPVFFNTCDLASRGRAWARRSRYYAPDEAEVIFAERQGKGELAVGGTDWRYVEAAQLRRDGKTAEAEVIEQRLDHERRLFLARWGIQV